MNKSIRSGLLPLLALVVAGTGCTTYRTLTPPPPSREASLDSSDRELRISTGVALAFECITPGGNPCSKGQATIDDTSVAKVYPAYLSRLDRFFSGTFTPSSYVVIGVKPGQTVLRIPDEDPMRVIVMD
ncbi:MAG: hypothetical protein ACOC1F_00830 [Myxococcota bacterium]